jgi:hypothetical protein
MRTELVLIRPRLCMCILLLLCERPSRCCLVLVPFHTNDKGIFVVVGAVVVHHARFQTRKEFNGTFNRRIKLSMSLPLVFGWCGY